MPVATKPPAIFIVKAINVSREPVNATVKVSGVNGFAPQAQLTVLASARLADNNSLDKPHEGHARRHQPIHSRSGIRP